jgi:phage terminase large subunit-like protein
VRERVRTQAAEVERGETYVRALSDTVVLHEWAVPADGDAGDLDLVKRANPFSGVTVEQLRRKRESPTMSEAHFRRFNCNLPTRADAAAISEAEWTAARTQERIPAGQGIWLGLDVAWKWDTTALVPLWVRDRSHRMLGPATILEPPRDGNSLDPRKVEDALRRIHARNPIHTVVMDPTRAEQLGVWIERELGARVLERMQTPALMAVDYERFMEALRQRWLLHSGDPSLTSHALNAVAKLAPNGRTIFERPERSQSPQLQSRRVIDALTAAAMVHAVATAELDAAPPMPLIALV